MMFVGLNPGGMLGLFIALMLVIDSIVNMDRDRFFAENWSGTLVRRCNATLYYSLFLASGAIMGNILFSHFA